MSVADIETVVVVHDRLTFPENKMNEFAKKTEEKNSKIKSIAIYQCSMFMLAHNIRIDFDLDSTVCMYFSSRINLFTNRQCLRLISTYIWFLWSQWPATEGEAKKTIY